MDNNKDPVNNFEDVLETVENELIRIKKGFGVDIKTFRNIDKYPKMFKLLVEQYYTAALVMIPNISVAGAPFDFNSSGASFPITLQNVKTRIERTKDELEQLITLYEKLETLPDDKKKKTNTYIKMLETDAMNNIAHSYEIYNDGYREEKGTKGNKTVDFSDNFRMNRQYGLDTKNVPEDLKIKLRLLNRFVRNSYTNLDSVVRQKLVPRGKSRILTESEERKQWSTLDLNDFSSLVRKGFRANSYRMKDDSIIELACGDYDVKHVILKEKGDRTQRSQILFLGEGFNTSVVNWHLGVTGEFDYSKELAHVPQVDFENVKPLLLRKMPNNEIIKKSLRNEIVSEMVKTDGIKDDSISIMDKLSQFKVIVSIWKKHGPSMDASRKRQFYDKCMYLQEELKYRLEGIELGPEMTRILKHVNLLGYVNKIKGIGQNNNKKVDIT